MTRTTGRTKDVLEDLLGTLRGNDELCDLLEYDPEEDVGSDSRIYARDPPDDRRPPIAVVVDVESDGSETNNTADEIRLSAPVEIEVTSSWYMDNYADLTLHDISDQVTRTMTVPGIPGLRSHGAVGWERTVPSEDVSRSIADEFHYERTRLYRPQVTNTTTTEETQPK
ncbi:hypothetical protein [Natrononativus amylolyticus]|uniref:hypothetical protein n=1 Tax=Natrononativus amylolyticus TaxID=2963434 RepID=UPI0020CF1311|nr:hypothetical protein [Natrononativus amylolyticus]